LIQLASNENPLGPSPKALAAMQRALRECHLYPDSDASELRERLADRHALRPDQVLIGGGSTDLIGIIARTLVAPGLNAITSERSFIVYSMATRAADANLIQVPMANDAFDLDAVVSAINPATRIIFLANPNNPTGTAFDADATDRFLAQIPRNVTVVLDEAYYEYAQDFAEERSVHYSNSLDYVREARSVVVLRTFSKAYGLAGMRIGYALGPSDLLGRFAEMRSTYSISRAAQAGALAALEDQAHIQEAVTNNATGAKWLRQELSNLGYCPVSTWGNFVYCDIREAAEEFSTRMTKEGILIRPLSLWGAPKAIRVTIGTPEQNQTFLRALKKVRTS
jgi:histidinol-phosphate aminotransferase